MSIHYQDATVTVHAGDCLDVLRELADASVDAVVTDPPYGLEFMGRDWDGSDGFRRSLNVADANRDNPFGRASRTSPEYRAGHLFQTWCQTWATECLRVLKPGGHLLAFGGTRTSHRLVSGIEDAGFEIRDSLVWLYGSGFPKSLDVSKAIDKAAGAQGNYGGPKSAAHAEMLARGVARRGEKHPGWDRPWMDDPESVSNAQRKYEPATDAARQWAGWGTALKPAHEPIVVARKPLTGTVASNVLQHGTGALNIDACRIGDEVLPEMTAGQSRIGTLERGVMATPERAGRWPANVILDEEAARLLDQQSGETAGVAGGMRQVEGKVTFTVGEKINAKRFEGGIKDWGGASRFMYTAKADSNERVHADGIAHPTVKPLDLMRWLVRFVTPPGGLVLDPFAGSGTTAEACILEGFRAIVIEREPDYLPLIEARVTRQRDPVRHLQITGGDLGLFDFENHQRGRH